MIPNKSEETNQKPAGGFLIAHFKRYPLATRPVRCHMRFLIFIVVALFAPAKAGACGCSQQTSAWHPHVDKYATVIFVGVVVKVAGPDSQGVVLIDFKVLESWRGVRGELVTIEVHNGRTSCDLQKASFQAGEKYLMSGTGIELTDSAPAELKLDLAKRPRYYNNYCGLRELLTETPFTPQELNLHFHNKVVKPIKDQPAAF